MRRLPAATAPRSRSYRGAAVPACREVRIGSRPGGRPVVPSRSGARQRLWSPISATLIAGGQQPGTRPRRSVAARGKNLTAVYLTHGPRRSLVRIEPDPRPLPGRASRRGPRGHRARAGAVHPGGPRLLLEPAVPRPDATGTPIGRYAGIWERRCPILGAASTLGLMVSGADADLSACRPVRL